MVCVENRANEHRQWHSTECDFHRVTMATARQPSDALLSLIFALGLDDQTVTGDCSTMSIGITTVLYFRITHCLKNVVQVLPFHCLEGNKSSSLHSETLTQWMRSRVGETLYTVQTPYLYSAARLHWVEKTHPYWLCSDMQITVRGFSKMSD